MDALILAAGRGERLWPLTADTPKPLLTLNGISLLEFHLHRLAAAGFERVIVNAAHAREKVHAFAKQWEQPRPAVVVSDEGPEPLETAGGIVHALPLLTTEHFAVINGDVLSDFDYATLAPPLRAAQLVLVPNPPHHPEGDFAIDHSVVRNEGKARYTFAGIACYRKSAFATLRPGKLALGPWLRALVTRADVTGVVHSGIWLDVGTHERLESARDVYRSWPNDRNRAR